MRIVVDSQHNITQLFKLISNNIKTKKINAECILDDYIFISPANLKVKQEVSSSTAKFIIDEFEQNIALNFIKPFELTKEDAEEILMLLSSDDELKQKRLEVLSKEVIESVFNGRINIDGLIKFRLDEYKKELKFTTELLIDELSAKKSYDEFIGLMKYFADIQSPVTETVVISESNGKYQLTDRDGKPIELNFDEELATEIVPFKLTGEDLLISNLMAAMPRKIIFDNINTDKPIINTITRIFEGRITH